MNNGGIRQVQDFMALNAQICVKSHIYLNLTKSVLAKRGFMVHVPEVAVASNRRHEPRRVTGVVERHVGRGRRRRGRHREVVAGAAARNARNSGIFAQTERSAHFSSGKIGKLCHNGDNNTNFYRVKIVPMVKWQEW